VLIALTAYFFKENGLLVLCALVTLRSAFEYARMTLVASGAPAALKYTFMLLSFLIYIAIVWAEQHALSVLAISSISFLSVCVMQIRNRTELATTIRWQAFGLLGFIYTGIFPALGTKTLQLDGGRYWLYSLFFIVFCGDTIAYLVGSRWGKHKLLEAVSPKKSVEGAIGGLFGSALGGLIMSFMSFQKLDLVVIIPAAIVTGAFAQVGDLFESQLKRLAEVKDSGTLMPGHGGALDRIDGVLFAAPIYYALFRFFLN
jgi:phosphatidate cytidylyltransferase